MSDPTISPSVSSLISETGGGRSPATGAYVESDPAPDVSSALMGWEPNDPENCPENGCLGWRGSHSLACPTLHRVCRFCGEWIEPVIRGWRHVGGEMRCHSQADPLLTINEHTGRDPHPDAWRMSATGWKPSADSEGGEPRG